MELMFNEQSAISHPNNLTDACSAVIQFVETYKTAESHGFKRIRYEQAFDQIFIAPDFTLNDFCYSPNFKGRYVGLLLGLARHPFVDSDSQEKQRFTENEFFIDRDGCRIPVKGLGAAYIYNSIGISFSFDHYWDQIKHRLHVEGTEVGEYDVIAISHPDHCAASEFLIHKDLWKPICLLECSDSPEDKKIHLRDDHGRDVLRAFAKRLCQSPYVSSIINSLPYNPHATDFIHDVKDNGLIEIVLTDTDQGLGLVLQSTGRNVRETRAIADILNENFA